MRAACPLPKRRVDAIKFLCSIFVHPTHSRAPTGGAVCRSGVRCLRVRPNQPGSRGASDTAFRALRPESWEPAGLPVSNSHRLASAARACGARLHGNHRGEAPQGAPAYVTGRQSLPMKGLAQPQGGHGCGVPHQRFAALHPPRLLSRRTGRTAAGCRAISRSADACLPGCLKCESAIDAQLIARVVPCV